MPLPFECRDGVLYVEDVALPAIAAAVGTPAYVYSSAALRNAARAFRAGLAPIRRKHLAFAVKANPNLAVLKLLAAEGYGADIVSAGEMLHALAAGMPASSIIFSGVGKSRRELSTALDAGIGQFNLELEEEGVVLAAMAAARGQRAPAVLRVNPDIDAGTHAKISTGRKQNKFGVAIDDALGIYARLSKLEGLALRGIAIHIGSQLSDLGPLEIAYARVGRLVSDLRAAGHTITHVDLGGGLGLSYRPGDVMPSPAAYGAMVWRVTRDWNVALMFEPGRFIAGDAGVLLTEVLWVKPGAVDPYVIVDAAMNDLARPALYDAFHDFVAVRPTGARMTANIAGPVCESGDTFAMGRDIDAVSAGDLAVFRTAGAYGATMASTYNCRALVPEVLVDGDRFAVVADRIAPEAMLAAQHIPAWITDEDRTSEPVLARKAA
ncbi:diaminopimelate decarboxylase [Sphingomonas sp. 10B4]|uniref:diaminopimelate decarboxylase n=1 Tax=Sphingomonas sp. 10B4 TaxID=3048575 RepID=UPI002AB43FAB|nr:diaminopimelate decarboxylase [Sphingomonas sp. 10B4]MDY7524313.1 diaminopimelate decarboxylase [Sphingomonas sp. 10B4]MEB0282221.1 diaminopimelate decarboxylase [Sphingomonas sp. 10B4]